MVIIFNLDVNLQELMNRLKLNANEYSTLLKTWTNELLQISDYLNSSMMSKHQLAELKKAKNRYSTMYTEISMVTPPAIILDEHRALLPIVKEFLDLLGKAQKVYYDEAFKLKENIEFEKLIEAHDTRNALNLKIFTQIKTIAEKLN
ncbi:hypothetical protein P9761_04325 [Brevibacillus centrosporus]|uniref:hypothetical protein n=1 Tax=Brevibacillus centrosporus TaxID=54910 RepID=UPI002E2050AA|nr:hypothetical protein [Brevibacillus centrosporus]